MAAIDLFKEALFDMLTETFEKVQGIYLDRGTSLFETLATIDAETASRPVSANCASLAAQVEHVRFYLDVLEGHLTDNPLPNVDWGEIWRVVHKVTSEQWTASQERLRASYDRVCTFLKSFDQWDADNKISDAMAIVVHTAYHLGEIRQALCTLK